MTGPQLRLRWTAIDGPELHCLHCGSWWSIGEEASEHWVIGRWAMCRVCIREANRLAFAKKCADDEAYRRRGAARWRRYGDWMKRNHPDLVRALQREASARHREREAERQRAAGSIDCEGKAA